MKHVCPMCMGSKEIFTGSKTEECTTCDENGNITKELLEIIEMDYLDEGDF